MRRRPDISVLIPCYNAGRYLRATIDSVLTQTGPLIEILALDDGSTDDTYSIIKSYGGRVRHATQPNAGVSVARNILMEEASGEYLQFLDADDLLTPGTLEKRLTLAASRGADLILCWWERISSEGTPLPPRQKSQHLTHLDLQGDRELAAFTWLWAPPAAVLYKAELARQAGPWSLELPVIQDARFLFDAMRLANKPTVAEHVGALYREHTTGSVSTRSELKFYTDVFTNTKQVAELWRKSNQLTRERSIAIGENFENCARVFLAHGRADYAEALSLAKRWAGRLRGRKMRLAHTLAKLGLSRPVAAVLRKNHTPQTA